MNQALLAQRKSEVVWTYLRRNAFPGRKKGDENLISPLIFHRKGLFPWSTKENMDLGMIGIDGLT
jgi:hypothetical protein